MEAGVFLLQADNSLVKMVEQPYEVESLLQRLLADHPDLLAGDQIDPATPRRWLLIQREAGVPATADGGSWWAVDHLFLDQDAIPTFVEVKRATDTRARREVVAQMLDYAANATEYWPVDHMREWLLQRCAASGIDPAAALDELIGADGDETAFWDLAQANLQSGRVRLLFVADRIPPWLRRIVEFLNRQMNPAEVLAIEIRQFAAPHEDARRTLVPRVIGQTEQIRNAKAAGRPPSRSRSTISYEEFIERLAPDKREIASAIVQIALAAGFVISEYRLNEKQAISAPITVPGVRSAPVTLDQDYLWVSLGRYHPSLREPVINQELRQAILRVSPASSAANDPQKSEVGIRLNTIEPEERDHLKELIALLWRTLSPT